jgi:hypothetical protein
MMTGGLDDLLLRDVRWTFCLAISKWREVGANGRSLRQIADGMRYPITDTQIREIILYLTDLGYCTFEELPDGSYRAIRTHKLTDLVEYNTDTPQSIARPAKQWW